MNKPKVILPPPERQMDVIIVAALDLTGAVAKRCACSCVERGVPLTSCEACGGFGHRNTITPWGNAYPEHTEHVEQLTRGRAVVAGRGTTEAYGQFWPLLGRFCVTVSTTHPDFDASAYVVPVLNGASPADSVDPLNPARNVGAIQLAKFYGERQLFVLGGAWLFEDALPFATELRLTFINRDWNGDVLFPCADQIAWHENSQVMSTDGWSFKRIAREPSRTSPDLTYTRWVRG